MSWEWDDEKRRRTLEERGLDFADCETVFAGPTFSYLDDRKDYGEDRHVTVGILDGQFVLIVHTDRQAATRIISMRKANVSEAAEYRKYLGFK